MIKFIERNKEIISTLSIVALVTVLSNGANADSGLDTKNNLSRKTPRKRFFWFLRQKS
jgi:hypothetical protein